jgi:hypothetical protein
MANPSRKLPSPPGVPPTSLMVRFSMAERIADLNFDFELIAGGREFGRGDRI